MHRGAVFVVLVVAVLGQATVTQSRAQAWEGPLCTFEATTTFESSLLSEPFVPEPLPATPRPAPHRPPDPQPTDLVCLDGGPADPATPPPVDRVVSEDPPVLGTGWQRVIALRERGRRNDALRELAALEPEFPRLSDRFALLRGELLFELGRTLAAKREFTKARESPDTAVAAQARVGQVRAAIANNERGADDELEALLRFYPELPTRSQLRFELAQSRERLRDFRNAVRIYRDLDSDRAGQRGGRRGPRTS